jgi:hypothetical protein
MSLAWIEYIVGLLNSYVFTLIYALANVLFGIVL